MLKRSNHRGKQQSVQNILGPISESAKPFRNSVNMSQFSIEIYWALFGVRLRCLDILGPQLWADTSACSHFETRPKSFLGSFQHYGLSLPVHSSHVQHLNKWNYFCIAGMPEGQERDPDCNQALELDDVSNNFIWSAGDVCKMQTMSLGNSIGGRLRSCLARALQINQLHVNTTWQIQHSHENSENIQYLWSSIHQWVWMVCKKYKCCDQVCYLWKDLKQSYDHNTAPLATKSC